MISRSNPSFFFLQSIKGEALSDKTPVNNIMYYHSLEKRNKRRRQKQCGSLSCTDWADLTGRSNFWCCDSEAIFSQQPS